MGRIVWYLRTMYRPRVAIKHFLFEQPKTETLFGLVALYGGLTFWEEFLSGNRPPGIMPLYFVIGWLGSAGGVYLVGRIFGGKATSAASMMAIGVSFVVPLAFTPASFPLNYLASRQHSEVQTPLELGVIVLGLVVAFWWISICVLAVSEVHGFGVAKSLITFALSLVAGAASVAITMVLIAFIL